VSGGAVQTRAAVLTRRRLTVIHGVEFTALTGCAGLTLTVE